MAQTQQDLRRAYPLPVYNYRVRVDDQTLAFSEVSGIKVEHENVVYRHGLSFREGERIQSCCFDRFSEITLKRGVVLGASSFFLFEWLVARDLRSLEVSLCDETGSSILAWRFSQALPVKLEAPSLVAESNEVAIETLEIKARGTSLGDPLGEQISVKRSPDFKGFLESHYVE